MSALTFMLIDDLKSEFEGQREDLSRDLGVRFPQVSQHRALALLRGEPPGAGEELDADVFLVDLKNMTPGHPEDTGANVLAELPSHFPGSALCICSGIIDKRLELERKYREKEAYRTALARASKRPHWIWPKTCLRLADERARPHGLDPESPDKEALFVRRVRRAWSRLKVVSGYGLETVHVFPFPFGDRVDSPRDVNSLCRALSFAGAWRRGTNTGRGGFCWARRGRVIGLSDTGIVAPLVFAALGDRGRWNAKPKHFESEVDDRGGPIAVREAGVLGAGSYQLHVDLGGTSWRLRQKKLDSLKCGPRKGPSGFNNLISKYPYAVRLQALLPRCAARGASMEFHEGYTVCEFKSSVPRLTFHITDGVMEREREEEGDAALEYADSECGRELPLYRRSPQGLLSISRREAYELVWAERRRQRGSSVRHESVVSDVVILIPARKVESPLRDTVEALARICAPIEGDESDP
ncbi:MAG: hypothetical protein K8T90_19290 [Planctomycetes bacterium]|nr:hypothetical protein [Planctomycetota bacterium]